LKHPRFWASAFYFAYFAAGGAYSSYLIIYYRQSGMSVPQIGILASLPTLMYLLGNPIWAAVADIFHMHKKLLPLTASLTIPAILLISLVHSFWLLSLMVLIFSLCISPVIALADYSVINMLGEKSYEYGKVRIWGAVSFGLSAWATGWLVERYGPPVLFMIFSAAMAAAVYISLQMQAPRLVRSQSYWQSLRKLSADYRWYAFLLGLFLVGLSFASINNYFILFMKSLGGGEGLFGLSVAFAGVSELPTFLFSSYLLRKLTAKRMLILGVFMMGVRCLLISLMVDPRMALLVQMMHGLTFSMIWIAGVSYTNEIAPPGMGATAQALFSATQFGLGNGIGALLGSQVYAAFGPVILYRSAAVSALCGFIFLLVISMRRKSLAVQ
jgi:MFS transporter, PPP family, 3-phenylpropionic acid transporter